MDLLGSNVANLYLDFTSIGVINKWTAGVVRKEIRARPSSPYLHLRWNRLLWVIDDGVCEFASCPV